MEYAYVNARIRAMKSRLLDPSLLEQLINKPDIDSLITELEKTAYREELEKAGVLYSGINRIEVAIRKDLVKRFRSILTLIKGGDTEAFLAIILSRWDVQNIKTILRGKKIQENPSEILECMIPAGELDEAALTELVKQPDVKAVIDLLATWGMVYARPLILNFKEFTDTGDMLVLEYALDTFYYEDAISKVKTSESDDARVLKNILITEIDINNIKTVLRAIRDRIDPDEVKRYFVKGSPEFDANKLLTMMKTGTIEGALKYLEQTPYQFITKIPPEYIAAEKISAFEKELERYLVKKAISQFLGDPLSIAIPIAYIWAKYTEVTNIRVIARCKVTEVPEKDLREALISV
ncbi:MAG: ATP synthase A1 subunit C [Methanoregulaceae archaeon]|jgi:V/A-type H+-transporting ATPase subunit C|nr:ATP synthase A1 subunit C [Methanoregulaceae archaeon]MCU0628465.1 ATP synthase A1 subunit C [Methanoregulaceae archaeon]